MNITDIRIRKTYDNDRLKALVSVTIDHDLAVHDLKVIAGPERLFVAMPSRKDESGVFRDIVHPITPEARKSMEEAVLAAYDEHLAKQEAEREFQTE
ncbi:MAG: septation regulator SpoVG [Oscillospiraceae bacterium]